MKKWFLCLAWCSLALGMVQAQPDRSRPPSPRPARALTLPPIHKFTLDNGLPVWVVQRRDVPVVQVDLTLPAGDLYDPPGQFGLAEFTAELLDEGAGGLNSLELADEVDYLGADLSAGTAYDYARVSLHSTSDKLAPALALMAKVVAEPEFPAEEVERQRKLSLTELLQVRSEPRALMAVALAKELYPSGHRYSAAVATEQQLRSFTRDDLTAFHRRHYQPRSSHLMVVGDVDPATLKTDLQRAFGVWQGPSLTVPGPSFPPVDQVRERRVVLVDKPGAAQTVIRIARLGVTRNTEDYYALKVLNTILGGAFTSRLNQNLREEHGYTYGAFSYFTMGWAAGPFAAGADVQTDKTGAALQEFFKELSAIREPVPEDELTKAKNYLAYNFPSDLQTNSGLSGALQEIWVYQLPEDFLSGFVEQVQGVTSEQVHRAALQHVDPERMVIMLVGDRKAIEPQLKGLSLGPVKHLSPDELFVEGTLSFDENRSAHAVQHRHPELQPR